jgi:glycine cleavage system protein P-like pyridoxal-binding family
MAFPACGGTVLIMTEPTISDVLERLNTFGAQVGAISERIDDIGARLAVVDMRLEKIDRRLDVVDSRFDHADARLEILIDSFGAFRRDYLRDHPRHEAG